MSVNTKAAQRARKGFRCTRRLGLLSLAAAAALPAAHSFATTRQWVGGTSNWNTAANWNPSGVPGSGDTANVTGTTSASQTITYNYNGTAQTLAVCTVDLIGGSAGSSETLSMSANTLAATTVNVGDSGSSSNGVGAFNQSGGDNAVGDVGLFLGYNATDQGSYNLSGGTASAGRELIGFNGTGTFSQTGGTHTLTGSNPEGDLSLGNSDTSSGAYTLSGGLLSVSE
jgi:hypothetical protein